MSGAVRRYFFSGRFLRLAFGGFGAVFDALAPCGSSAWGFSAAGAADAAAAVAFTAFLPESAAALAWRS